MTTVLVLNLEGEDALHSVWLIDQDTRPDLSATCGQATECPCAGCRKELECQDPHTQDRDSAEIDHDDPINQR